MATVLVLAVAGGTAAAVQLLSFGSSWVNQDPGSMSRGELVCQLEKLTSPRVRCRSS
jgi:hypothetical protein